MSTKTSMKRIALLAVSALGFGVLSLAPASAAAYVVTTPTVGAPSSCPALANPATTTIGFSVGTALVNGDTLSGATVSLTVPTGSTVSLTDRDGANSVATTAAFSTTGMTTNLGAGVAAGAVSATATGAVAAGAVIAGTITLVPDVVGTYTVTMTTSDGAAASKSFQAGHPFTVTGALVAGSLTGANCAAVSASQVAGAGNYVSVVANTALVGPAAPGFDFMTVSGSTFVNSIGFDTTSPLNNSTTRVMAIGDSIAAADQVWVAAETAGTITVKLIRRTYAAGIATDTTLQTITITVGSAALDAVNSTAFIGSGATPVAADATLTPVAYNASGVVANVSYSFVNLLGTPFTGTSPVFSATVTGPGLLANRVAGVCPVSASAGAAKVISLTAPSETFCVYADGTSGTATISILAGTTVWKTKSVTFYGPAASFKVDSTTSSALGAGKLAVALGVGDQNWWDLSTVDAAGNAVAATPSITVAIADTTILSNVSDVPGVVKVQGVKAGTTTFTVTSGTVTLGPVTVNVSEKTATSATMTLDKSTYQTGEAFTLTIDAKDSGGRALADATYNGMATLTTNVLVPGVAGTPIALGNPTFVNGKATLSGFMPATTGSVAFTLTLGAAGTPGVATAAAGAVLKASAEVSSAAISAADAAADAAAEAIDAANAATDAANLAAEAADAATVAAEEARDAADAATAAVEELASQVAALFAALKAQLTTLANTVAKIAKKVKA